MKVRSFPKPNGTWNWARTFTRHNPRISDDYIMVTHLYSSFFKDPKVYEQAEQFWDRLCREVIAQHAARKKWKPYLGPTTFANGTVLKDGNPIYNLMNPSSRKGFRIIQNPPTRSKKVRITAFTDKYGEYPPIGDWRGQEAKVFELVICCVLSVESADIARRLLIEWVKTRDIDTNFGAVIHSIIFPAYYQ